MVKASPLISATNAGEWSELMDGRADLEGYRSACHRLENYIPVIQGPGIRRPGTMFVSHVKNSASRSWLVPFIRRRSVAYHIEFGHNYCRFHFNRGIVLTGATVAITGATQANPVVVTTGASHGYSNGDDVFIADLVGMDELNGRFFQVANVTSTTFELRDLYGSDVDGTGYGAYTSGGTVDVPYEIASPYSESDLLTDKNELGIDYAQQGDVLYIAHRGGTIAPRKLTRTSSTSWAFATVDPDTGPFEDLNATDTTMYVSAATGVDISITASTSVFTANHVGSIIRIQQDSLSTDPWESSKSVSSGVFRRSEGHEYESGSTGTTGSVTPSHTSGTVSDGTVDWTYTTSNMGIARITAQSGTTATADVLTRFPQSVVGEANASKFWRFGAWSAEYGYPTTVGFFRRRLIWGRGFRSFQSQSGDFENFGIDEFGDTTAESAITLDVQSEETNEIVGFAEGDDLAVLTEGAEFLVGSLTTTDPYGPNNVRQRKQTAYGSRPIKPKRVGEAILFPTNSGQKIREMRYDIEVDNLQARDMTVRSRGILRPRIISMAWQQEPDDVLWTIRSDGQIATFTYDRPQQTLGWARQIIGGVFGNGNAEVESVSTIPSPDTTRDDVWIIVKRTVNGVTRRYIEYIAPSYETGDDERLVHYVDSGLVYDGSSVNQVGGLHHLIGQTVAILADGAVQPEQIVASDGTITLQNSATASKIVVGLPYTSTYASMRIEAGATDGTAQGKTKRIYEVIFRFVNSLGGSAGPDLNNLTPIPDLSYRAPSTPMGSPPGFYTGDVTLEWLGDWEKAARIWFQISDPLPSTIIAVMPQVETTNRGLNT